MYYKDILIDEIKLLSGSTLPPLPAIPLDEFNELKDNIKEFGIIQPLVVTKADDSGYLLRAGYHRLRAAKELGMKLVPCMVEPSSGYNTDIRMGMSTDVYRRHLTPEQRREHIKQISGMKHINEPPAKKEEIPEQYQSLIASLKKQLKDTKEEVKKLSEDKKRILEDVDDARFDLHRTTPTDDERVKVLQNSLEDMTRRANEVSEALENKNSAYDALQDELRKAINAYDSVKANTNALVHHQKQETIAENKLFAAEGFLEKTQKLLEEVYEIVKRNKVSVNTEILCTLLGKAAKTASEIPCYPKPNGHPMIPHV